VAAYIGSVLVQVCMSCCSGEVYDFAPQHSVGNITEHRRNERETN